MFGSAPFALGTKQDPSQSEHKEESADLDDLASMLQKSCTVCAKEIGKSLKTNKAPNNETLREYYLKVIESDDAESLLRNLSREIQKDFLGGLDMKEYYGAEECGKFALRCDVVGDGDAWTEVIEFNDPSDCISFGRMAWCEVNLNAESFGSYVSRLHFVMMRHPQGILCVDLGSLRGLALFETEEDDPGLDYSYGDDCRTPLIFNIPEQDDCWFIRAGDARMKFSRYFGEELEMDDHDL